MTVEISNLSKLIEEMRKELIQLGSCKSFTDPDVVKLSQKLDRLLDEYQELQYNLKYETTWFERDDIPLLVRYRIDDDKKVS